jgi:hypothetical protein
MKAWLRALRVLTSLELRRFLRTPGVYRYLLVPGWMILPITLLVATAVLTTDGFSTRVVIPRDLPDDLPLAEALMAQGLEPVMVADPSQEWQTGRARGAFLSYEVDDGLFGALPPLEGGDARYRFEAVALDVRTRDLMNAAVREAGTATLEGILAASGGDPARDLQSAPVTLDIEAEGASGPVTVSASSLAAYLVWLLGLVGYLLLVGGPVADRNDGVIESVLTTPTPPTAYLTARVLAVTIVQGIAGFVLYGGVYLLLSSRISLLPPLGAPTAVLAAASVLNAGYLALGILSPSLKTASNAAGMLWLAASVGMAASALSGAPSWVPLTGVASAMTATHWWQSTASSVVAVIVVVTATARALDRRPQLKIGGDR